MRIKTNTMSIISTIPTRVNGDSYLGDLESLLVEECSGGYGCEEEEQTDTAYRWLLDTPIPDDMDKVPKNCNILKPNIGKNNEDPIIIIDDTELLNLTTSDWTLEMNTSDNQLRVIPPKL